MNFDIRHLTAEDETAHRELMALAFEQGRVATPESDDAPEAGDKKEEYTAHLWGLFDEGQLRSSIEIRPFEVCWGTETTLRMGGIAGVASWPETRGAGHVDALLRHALATMREAGQVISALYPFSWSFYRKFGWAWVGDRREVTLPLRELPRFPEYQGVMERLTGDAVKARLRPGYEAFARQYHGMFAGESHQWRALKPAQERQSYVFLYPPTGEYAIWHYGKDEKSGRIRQSTFWTPEGHKALLTLLHYLANQCETAEVAVPADALLPHFVMHWDLKLSQRPVFMGRVVDVAAALGCLPAPDGFSGTVPIRLADEHAPWNNGDWLLGVSGDRIHAESVPAAGDSPISMDIQTFSQAFWGTPGLAELRRAGQVAVRDEAAFALLAQLMPTTPVYTQDFF